MVFEADELKIAATKGSGVPHDDGATPVGRDDHPSDDPFTRFVFGIAGTFQGNRAITVDDDPPDATSFEHRGAGAAGFFDQPGIEHIATQSTRTFLGVGEVKGYAMPLAGGKFHRR